MSTTNTGIPNPPHKGEPISARFMRAITDTLNRQRVIAGENVRIEQGMSGTIIHARAKPGGSDFDWGAFPFRVIDATFVDVETGARTAKVRVLPGVCNFTIPTVAGASNEYWTEGAHVAEAPRIDCSDVNLAGGFWIALEFAAPSASEIHPSAVDTVAVQSLDTNHLPLARVVAELDEGANEVVIKQIRQMVFDVVGATAAARDPYGDPIWAITR